MAMPTIDKTADWSAHENCDHTPNRTTLAAMNESDRAIARAKLTKEIIGKWTFYYNPQEIKMDNRTRTFLENFRTEDGETCFVLTSDDEGLVIY